MKKNYSFLGGVYFYILFSIVLFYLVAAATNGVSLFYNASSSEYFNQIHDPELHPEVGYHYGYYNLLADSIAAGSLSLPIKPKQELLTLTNPYDGRINGGLRLHDASLKNGEYYLYFGIVPALLFFFPFRLIGQAMISEALVIALLYIFSFLLSYKIVLRLLKLVNISTVYWNSLALFSLGFGGGVLFMLRRPCVYEVAIASGSFFALASFYLLIRYYEGTSCQRFVSGLIGTTASLAVGCRPSWILLGPLIGVVVLALWVRKPRNWRMALSELLAFSMPYFSIIGLLFYYNYLRFGSWTEFGSTYQLPGAYIAPPETLFRFCNLIPGLIHYLLALPGFKSFFPFFFANKGLPGPWPEGYVSAEEITGAFYLAPIIIACLAWPFLLLFRKDPLYKEKAILAALPILFGVSMLLFLSFAFPSTTMRYLSDFLPFLLIGGLVTSIFLLQQLHGVTRTIAIAGLWGCVIWSVLLNTALGFTGYYDLFKRAHPKSYAAIESSISPLVAPFISSPPQPELLDVVSVLGTGKTSDGSQVMVLGTSEAGIRLYIPEKARVLLTLALQAIGEPNPGSTRIVKARAQGTEVESSMPITNTLQTLEFNLKPGVNWIFFEAQELGSTAQPLPLKPMALAQIKNIQVAPILKK